MKIHNLKLVNSDVIDCIFDLEIEECMFTIKEIKLMNTKAGKWISMPSRSYIDKDGSKKYYPLFVLHQDVKKPMEKKILELVDAELKANPPKAPQQNDKFISLF
jgi:DNA-binding cell septation regulator SpoVG